MSVADEVKRLEEENVRLRNALEGAIVSLQKALVDVGTNDSPTESPPKPEGEGGQGEYRVDTSGFMRKQDG